MLYYIIYNNTQQGPMNKEELVKYGLTNSLDKAELKKLIDERNFVL